MLALDSQGVIMAKLIQFYVPQNFKPPKRQWQPQEQRGKIIEFRKCFDKEVCLVTRRTMCWLHYSVC